MHRVLEPELMDDEQQSLAYAQADFSTSNQFFVDSLIRELPPDACRVLDIGCGPGDVVIRLARAAPAARITAIDGSAPMIALARASIRGAALEDRVTALRGYVPGVALDEHAFDMVVSKDLLHHLPDPSVLWSEVVRLGKVDARVYVMDLVRPASTGAAWGIVNRVAASESPILREDFFNSLCAAFTVDEVRRQLAEAHLHLDVAQVTDRHLLVKGPLNL